MSLDSSTPSPRHASGLVLLRTRATVAAPSRQRSRDFYVKRLLATADLAAITIAIAVAALTADTHTGSRFVWGLATLPVWLLLFRLYGLYDRDSKRVSHTTVDDLPWLFHALVIGALLMWLFFRAVAGYKLTFVEMIGFGGCALLVDMALRSAARSLALRMLTPERVLLSAGAMTSALVRKMRAHPEYGLSPIGVIGSSDELPTLGSADEVPRIVEQHRIERIVLSTTGMDTADQLEVLRQSKELSVKVSLLPEVFDALGPSLEVDDVEGVTLLGVHPPVLTPSARLLKRCLDLSGAAVLLLVLGPAMAVIAAAIKLDSRGPAFFRQSRIGKDGQPFRVWKFRTMRPDAEQLAAALREHSKDPHWLHLEHDPRITRGGRLLRLTSLDELPQLFNVLKGEMSLVGPRPLVEDEDRRVDGWGRSRIYLTPGITGLWQVLGRTNIPFDEMVKLDYLYVTNWSLWNDIRLILRTLPAVVQRRGAN